MSSHVLKMDAPRRNGLKKALENAGYTLGKEAHTDFVARGQGLVIKAYKSGKVLIQGQGIEGFVEIFLESHGLLEEAEVLPEPLIGTDESGKGDYFGPLTVAAVYVRPEDVKKLRSAGVDDCKALSDSRIHSLGEMIRTNLPSAVVVFSPKEYNKKYKEYGNLNKLLAYGHGEAIARLMEKGFQCPVLTDQFGNKKLVEDALVSRGLQVKLEQRHRAEDNIAVAAASIVAREAFLLTLEELSDAEGILLPKGASREVVAVAKEILQNGGNNRLKKVAKTHFKTTGELMKLF